MLIAVIVVWCVLSILTAFVWALIAGQGRGSHDLADEVLAEVQTLLVEMQTVKIGEPRPVVDALELWERVREIGAS